MINYNNILIDNCKSRLVYSFFIADNIKSFDDHISYKLHLTALQFIFNTFFTFNEVIFIISANDLNNPLIKDLQFKLSNILINVISVRFIIEKNNPNYREGIIFKKYVLDKLDEYDGITLFFHNKGLDSKYEDDFPFMWILGQYYFNTISPYTYLECFIKNDNLYLYGWPYVHDEFHKQWLYAGSCYWMKCQEINKYLENNKNEFEDKLKIKTLAEYYFLTRIDNTHVDYPLSNIIKNDIIIFNHYKLINNTSFNKYIQNTLPYSVYINFMSFYNYILDEINGKI